MPFSTSAYLSTGGLLVFGTTTSLFAKIVYELEGIGTDGSNKLFTKPWAMTCVMFLGMSLCLPLAYWQQHKANKRRAAGAAVEDPLLGDVDINKPAKSETREVLLLGIPTAFDLVATILMNIGLLSVTASVYQMMRGAEMLFAAAFSVMFLQRSLNRFHLGGILCCVVGICTVGAASLLTGEGSAQRDVSQWQMFGGMMLIILSQAVQAAQITFEDFFLSSMEIAPLKIVGFEGLWGSLAMILVLLPIVQHVPGQEGTGLHENTIDTLHMIRSSPAIATVLVVDMFALLMYNISGMCVTGYLGAVFRTVLETMRTLFVWLVDLLLFYTPLGHGKLGESWSVYSYMQAAGFLILVAGTLIYGRGDDEEGKAAREALAAPTMDAEAAAPVAATTPVAPPASQGIAVSAPSGPISRPIACGTPSSFKSTMNINTHRGSYVGSYLQQHDLGFGQQPDE